MMVMTAKVNFKKLAIILAAIVGLILAVILLAGRGGKNQATSAPAAHNENRVKLLEDMGWQVSASPVEAGRVKIPKESSEVFERYNALQKSQGYDLSQYAGQTVMRYVYKVNNYPGATEPVYATLLVHKERVIGADITDTGPNGVVQGLKRLPEQTEPTKQAEETTQTQ